MKNSETFRWICLLAFSFLIAGLSLLMWKLPLQLAAPNFYEMYLVPANGHFFSYILVSWFMVGGYKTALLMLWDSNEEYFTSFKYRLKALIFVPFAPITKFKSNWYKMPSVDKLKKPY